MSGVNQITIVGNVGQTPDLKYTEGGKPYCRFSVAVNEQWKTDGERRARVTWFPVVAFDSKSEACANFLDRGRLVGIQGRVQTRAYEGKDGTQHQVMQVIAEKVTFLGPSKRDTDDEQRPVPGQPVGNGQQARTEDMASDCPF
jgi:single-strand DNA-binding protein